MQKIINAQAQPDNILRVEFQSGEIKDCDISAFLNKGIFTELRDASVFNKFTNTGFSVEWENEADLSADTLYMIGK